MSIITTNGAFLSAVRSHGFNKLANATLSPSEKLKVYRTIKRITDLAEDVEKVRAELIEACAEKDEEGNLVTVESDGGRVSVKLQDAETLVNWLDEALKVPVEPLSAAALLQAETLTPADLVGLGPLVGD
jgi:hypothetical protein